MHLCPYPETRRALPVPVASPSGVGHSAHQLAGDSPDGGALGGGTLSAEGALAGGCTLDGGGALEGGGALDGGCTLVGGSLVGGEEGGVGPGVEEPEEGGVLVGVDTLAEGVGDAGGCVFLSCAPVSPRSRATQARWSGSYSTKTSTIRVLGSTATTFDERYDGQASPTRRTLPCWAIGGVSGLPQAQRTPGMPWASTSTAVPAWRTAW